MLTPTQTHTHTHTYTLETGCVNTKGRTYRCPHGEGPAEGPRSGEGVVVLSTTRCDDALRGVSGACVMIVSRLRLRLNVIFRYFQIKLRGKYHKKVSKHRTVT